MIFSIIDAIVVDEHAPSPKLIWWIQDLNLTNSDYDILLTDTELSQGIVNAAQLLLSKQCPRLVGFQDTTLGPLLQFSIASNKGVQILHLGM